MVFLLSLIASLLFAFEIPSQLDATDQSTLLKTVGLGTNTKFLSNAYPLGGHSGLEASISVESLDTNEVSNLGSTVPGGENLVYPNITIGKGIFNDSDIFLQFMPPQRNKKLTRFGASYRWTFYKNKYFPINLAAIVNLSTANFKNKLTTRNVGGDLMAGVTLSDFSFYLGGGYYNSSGLFKGGASGVTSSNLTEYRKVGSPHYFLGGTYNFEPMFVAAGMDRYVDTVFTLKSGFIF